MDQQELARILKEMYDNPVGARLTTTRNARKKTMVHLFGIMYAEEIQKCGDSPTRTAREIAQGAGIPKSYRMDIVRGRLLEEYVTIRDRSDLKWRA